MARWKLTEPHYLNVPGIFWEQVTNDRITQRPIRKQYKVPLFLDPRIDTDWTEKDPFNPMDGSINVCYAGKGADRDIIFEGNPTPGMLPLDDEAREISAKFDWTPTQGIDDQSIAASHQTKILDGLIQRLAEANVANPTGAPAGFEKLMESMAAMMQQQTQLFAALLQKQQQGEFEAQVRKADGGAPPEIAEPLEEADEPTEDELVASEAMARKQEAEAAAKQTAERKLAEAVATEARSKRRA